MFIERQSVGLVEPRRFSFGSPEEPMVLDSGRTLGPVEQVYETYGRPNADRSNAVLICHALSGDAHAAGIHTPHQARQFFIDNFYQLLSGGQTLKYILAKGPLTNVLNESFYDLIIDIRL